MAAELGIEQGPRDGSARTAFRPGLSGNLEKAGVSQGVATKISGHKTTAVNRLYRIEAVSRFQLPPPQTRRAACAPRSVPQSQHWARCRDGIRGSPDARGQRAHSRIRQGDRLVTV